jgi:outer membrane protein assembly complex protein YaeT
MKRRWKILTGIIAVVVMFVAVLHFPPIRNLVLRHISDYLRAGQGIELTAESFSYNLLTLSVTIDGLVLRSTAPWDPAPFLTADSVVAGISLPSLFRQRPVITDASVDNLRIMIINDPQNRDNLPYDPSPDTADTDGIPGLPPPLLIENLQVEHGSFLYRHEALEIEVELPYWKLGIEGDPGEWSQIIGFRTEETGQVKFQTRYLPIGNLDIDLELNPETLHLTQLSLRLEESLLSGDGTINDFNHPDIDMHLTADLKVGRLLQFLGIPLEIDGEMGIMASVSGPLGLTSISTEISGKNLSYGEFKNIELSLTAGLEQDSETIRIDPIRITSLHGSITGQVALALSTEPGTREARTSTASVHLEQLDLETLTHQLLPIGIASRATGDVDIRWPGMEFAQAEMDAAFQLSASRNMPAPDILPVTASVSAKLAGDRIDAQIRSGEILDLGFQGNVSLSSWQDLNGNLSIRTDTIGPTIRALESFTGTEPGALVGTELDGPLIIEMELGGTMDALRIAAEATAPETRIGELRNVAIAARVDYSPEQVVVPGVSVTWENQSLTAGGSIGIGDEQTRLDLTARIEEGSLEAVVAALGEALPIEGSFSLDAVIGGTVENIDLTADLSMWGISAYGQRMGELDARTVIRDNVVELERFELIRPEEEGAGSLAAGGDYHLETGAYSFQVTAFDFHFVFDETNTANVPPMQGVLDFSVSGSGTDDQPSLSAELNLSEFEVSDWTVGELILTAHLDGQRADAAVRLPRFNVAMNAEAGIERPYPVQFETSVDTDLSIFGIRMREDEILDGHVTAMIEGSGDVEHWRDGNLFFRATDLRVSIQDHEIVNRAPIVLRYDNHRIISESLELASRTSTVSVQGSLPLAAAVTPEAASAPETPGIIEDIVEIEGRLDLAELLTFLPSPPDFSVDGILHLDGTVRGGLHHPDPTLQLRMTDGRFAHPALRTLLDITDLDVHYEKALVDIRSFAANLGKGSILVSGTVPIDLLPDTMGPVTPRDVPARFSADVNDLQINSFSQIPEAADGIIGFRLEGETADITDFNSMNANLVFHQLRLRVGEFELLQDSPAELSIAGGVFSIDHFLLTAPAARLHAGGTIDLTGDQAVNLETGGNINIEIVTLFVNDIRAEGESRFELTVNGTLSDPRASGFVEISDGIFSLPAPPLSATDLDVLIRIDQQRVEIETFTAILNGGRLEIEGMTELGEPGIQDIDINVVLTNAYFNYPDGLRTRVSSDAQISMQEEFIIIGGIVRVPEGSYRQNLDMMAQLRGFLQADDGVLFEEEQQPFLSRLRYDLTVETLDDGLLIDNNLAELRAFVDLRLTGSYYDPGLIGRVNLDEGGRLFFHERIYLVERGIITFLKETEIEPRLDIMATTQVRDYLITLNLTGTPEDLDADLTSDPPLSQPDIIALLLTGRELRDLHGEGLSVAKEQVEAFFSGQMAQFLSRGLENVIGLSMVRIDPSLISPEADPGARLTVGDDITRDLFLIYSMNLADAGDRIISLEYTITRNFRTEATRQSDNSYRFDLGHTLRFGGVARPRRVDRIEERRIGELRVTGTPVFPSDRILNEFRVKSGDRYDFYRIQDRLDRLQNFYLEHDHLESRIRLQRDEQGREVHLDIRVEAGPVVEIAYEGWVPPRDTRQQVSTAWSEGLFDRHRVQTATERIERAAAETGYLHAEIKADVSTSSEGIKRILFEIDPGVRYRNVDVFFEGASGIDPEQLRSVLENERLLRRIHLDPGEVTRFLRRYYRQQGFRDVEVRDVRYDLDTKAETGTVVIPIQEGPRFTIENLDFSGNAAFSESLLRHEIPLVEGGRYSPEALMDSHDAIQRLYWAYGYNNVIINYRLGRSDNAGSAVNITFEIRENEQQIVRDIIIRGNRITGEGMIRSQITLRPGDVLNHQETTQSRSNLYDTRAYSLVDIETLPFTGPQPIHLSNQRPVDLLVTVNEVQPFTLRYSGFYDTDRGLGGIADFSNRNSLGSARLIGTRVRYDADIQEVRGYFSQPFLQRFPIHTDMTSYFRRESIAGIEDPGLTFSTDVIGFSLQQEVRLQNRFVLNYGYRFEHSQLEGIIPEPELVTVQNTAPLTFTMSRESRNNFLDSYEGSFTSQAFEYAPSYLGSDLRFYRYFGQYFHYLPLSRPVRVPWVGETRSRLVFAGGIRVGLAGGLDGQDLITSQKFFAGGGTTIRGFAQNEVGPMGTLGTPAGGNALFMINTEIRFPVFSIFDGVGFLDVGNVYETLRDFNPAKVRAGTGLGLRIRTPYLLLRADYGIKVDRRPGESPGQFFFSIGQAF